MFDQNWLNIAFFYFLGSCFGSFANVVILRVPKGESVVLPASRCPKCKKKIQWFDNIPVFSWILLRGRCRSCRKAISWRYPLVELITGLLFCFLFLKMGLSWRLLELLILGWGLVAVSFIDFDHQIIPDVISLPGIVVGLLGAFLNPHRDFLSALAGVLAGGGFLWLVAYLYWIFRKEEGLGGGDIKLLAWIGAVLGWPAIPFVILSSSIIGSIVGIVLGLKNKTGLKTAIPFGPYIALGAIWYVLGGYRIALWYLRLFFPDIPEFDI